MTAAILCIGTELTRGEILNRNAQWLSERLTEQGHEVLESVVVPDEPGLLSDTLRRLGSAYDVLVCTGGLGPTTDDLTTECVANVLGVPLERDAESLARIEQRMARVGRVMAPSNAKQADFPAGARILQNDHGTAPGFAVTIGRALCFFMPGVPREMYAMYERHVLPVIALPSEHVAQVRVRSFGLPESTVNDALAGLEQQFAVTLGYRAHFPEIEVKALARGADPEQVRAAARRAADEVVRRLGSDVVFGEGDVTLPAALGALLVERGYMLGLAESCTGGTAAALITETPGSSRYFKGGVIAYHNEVKERMLGVPPALIQEHGAVSSEVATAMARGALSALNVEVALALTGIAGPDGGSAEKPVGLVYAAVATSAGVSTRKLQLPFPRVMVQKAAAFAGLSLSRHVLRHGHD